MEAEGIKVDKAILLGGFSFCRALSDKLLHEFKPKFNIECLGDKSSLAIVIGAAQFSNYNLIKTIQ